MAATTDYGYNAGYRVRVRVFVYFWNFDISMRQRGFYSDDYSVDWRKLGPCLARHAQRIVDDTALTTYQGMNIYGSYDSNNRKDDGLRRWMSNTVSKFSGVDTIRRKALSVQRVTKKYGVVRVRDARPICAEPRKKVLTHESQPT